MTVAEHFVRERPLSQAFPWFVMQLNPSPPAAGPLPVAANPSLPVAGPLLVGVDIPLNTKLSDWHGRLDWKALYTAAPLPNLTYEKMAWAIASVRANLKWPAWNATDADPINGRSLGSVDNSQRGCTAEILRLLRGVREPPGNQSDNILDSNDLRHLILLAGDDGSTRCANMWGILAVCVTPGNLGPDAFIQGLLAGFDQGKVLPVWQTSTKVVTYPYHDAMEAFKTWQQEESKQ